MRTALITITILCISVFSVSISAQAIEVEQQPPDLPQSPVLITGYYTHGGGLVYVQLFNNSGTIVDLVDWNIEFVTHDTEEDEHILQIPLSGYLLPRSYAVIADSGLVDRADMTFSYQHEAVDSTPTRLAIQSPEYQPYQTRGDVFAGGVRYQMEPTTAGNYTNTRPFVEVDTDYQLFGGGIYTPADSSPLRIVEVHTNPRLCAPTKQDVSCYNYVKIQNISSDTVNLADYRVRIGHLNESSGIANTVHLNGLLNSGEFIPVFQRDDGARLNIASSAGYVWIEDVHGLTLYEDSEVAYSGLGGVANRGFAWALQDDGTWDWSRPNPFGGNDFNVIRATANEDTRVPCNANQYRSEETGRCRLVAQGNTLTPCREGQYRHPDTNRCRNIASTQSQLTPCRANQYRNPETNRCRNIATANQLTPCREGQERNPETNRCRTIRSAAPAAADFAVEEYDEGDDVRFSWAVMGTAGSLAVGYGLWQWRFELLSTIRRLISKS